MKNKIISIFLCAVMLSSMLMGCSDTEPKETAITGAENAMENNMEDEASQKARSDNLGSDPMKELLQDPYEDYKEKGGEIAFVLNGVVMDGSYNEDIYEGIQVYALAAGISFSAYIADEESTEEYRETIEEAIADHARVIICAGYEFGETVGYLQKIYPEVAFLLVDGVPVDESGEPVAIADNVHCISFHEEESGYLAGYMAVLEGNRRLGFIGGVSEPPIIRYGYGYLQGINDAAADIGAEDVSVNYWYAETFEQNSEIHEKASEWYAEGTEIIFACGGDLYESVLEAADGEDGMMIGVDVDQSGISDRFLTSAVKGTSNAVIIALDDFYAAGMRWPEEAAGQEIQYGIQDNCTGIPVVNTEWRFKNVTMEDFYEVYKKVKSGEISVSNETDVLPKVSVAVNFDEAGE